MDNNYQEESFFKTSETDELKNRGIDVEQQTSEKQSMFKRPFSFKGRIRRLEYGLSMLIYFVYVLPMELIDENDLSAGFAIFWLLLLIPMLWFYLAQGAKRCHDRGNSGWFQIIPFYGLWMLFAEGDLGKNEYGDNPKGEGNISD